MKWRLWLAPPCRGDEAMAWDEALFLSEASRPEGTPVLRFYTWQPSTLSLGRFQHPEAGLNPGISQGSPLPVVRRTTGGGAIWHDQELTYSLTCHQEHLEVSGVKASFELLCGFILKTWQAFGWEAGFARDSDPQGRWGAVTAACFAGTEEYDILVQGKKLGGNAQRRQGKAIFQHGSLPLRLNWDILRQIFRPEDCPSPEHVTDLASQGWLGTPQELAEQLAEQFCRHLDVVPELWEPGPAEYQLFQKSLEKYQDPEWTLRGYGAVRDFNHIASP